MITILADMHHHHAISICSDHITHRPWTVDM